MKFRLFMGLVAITSLFIVSCGGPQGEKARASDAQEVVEATGDEYITDLAASNIEWVGTKPTGQHHGTISLQDGFISISNGVITGGEFVIDMNTIAVLDLTDAKMNGNLKGHLMSADFFDVATYPASRFVITSVQPIDGAEAAHEVSGNLTMKDVTKGISFKATIAIADNNVIASTDNFIINRADWNIKYGSKSFFDNLKDNFINDEISLKIYLVANRK